MTHTRQYADSDGDFSAWKVSSEPCRTLVPSDSTGGVLRECGGLVQYRCWESSDGAFEDYQYRCAHGHTWWIDGIDS